MRILIIEDNPTTASFLYAGLKDHQFIPEIASDGEIGLYLALNNPYQAIILDLMLPKIDGLTLLKKIRDAKRDVPIICLTARDTVRDRVQGLEGGADDYLVKPFAFAELLARLQTVLKRRAPVSSRVIQMADLLIDQDQFKAFRHHELLALSAKEFMLLCLFANKAGQVLTRTFIAEQVWDIHFDANTNAIDVAVNRLRHKVDAQHAVKLIHTVRGIGYVMEVR